MNASGIGFIVLAVRVHPPGVTKPVTDTSPAPDWVAVGSFTAGTGLVVLTFGLGDFDETDSNRERSLKWVAKSSGLVPISDVLNLDSTLFMLTKCLLTQSRTAKYLQRR